MTKQTLHFKACKDNSVHCILYTVMHWWYEKQNSSKSASHLQASFFVPSLYHLCQTVSGLVLKMFHVSCTIKQNSPSFLGLYELSVIFSLIFHFCVMVRRCKSHTCIKDTQTLPFPFLYLPLTLTYFTLAYLCRKP